MESGTAYFNLYPHGRRTHHILLIDDNAQLRAVMARHILFNCRERSRSCALYHITEKGQTLLNFFEPGSETAGSASAELDFAIYESNSPRQALNWLQRNRLSSLIIVSDVMMPIDTEIGLDGLLEGLSEMALPVNMLFVSSETQSKSFVQKLVAPQQAFFVTKGSDGWAKLPDALVRYASTLPYRPIPRNRPAHLAYLREADTEFSTDFYSIPAVKTPALATATASKSQQFNSNAYKSNSSTATPQVAVPREPLPPNADDSYSEDLPRIGFWSRLLRFLRG